jgi:hypothetical protein
MPLTKAALIGRDNPLPTPSGVTFQSVVPGTYSGALGNSWTHTLTSPTNCLLVAVAAQSNFEASMSIDTGQTFTQLGSFFYTGFSNLWFQLYGLMNPTIGTRTITVTVPAFAGYGCGGSSIAYSGVTGFAATGTALGFSTTSLNIALPAFPGAVAVQQSQAGWSSITQTSRQSTGTHGWQESRNNTAVAAATVKGTANAVLGTSVTIPAHDVGDEIVVFAYQNGIAAAPTAPAANATTGVPSWVSVQSGGGNSNGSGVWRFTATTNSHISGTWSSCTGLIAVVIQGVHPTTPVGGFGVTNGNASYSATPTITQSVTDGSSCLLYFHGHRSNVTVLGAAPTGFTRRAEAIGSSGICLNTKDDTTSDGGVIQTDNGNGGFMGHTVEIKANTAVTRNFSTTWGTAANYGAVAVVLK